MEEKHTYSQQGNAEETDKLLRYLDEDQNLDGNNLARLLAQQKIDKLKLISENTIDVICLHHPVDARYLYASPSTEKIMGYSPEDLAGKVPFDFVHPDHLTPLANNLGVSKEAKAILPEKLELRFRLKDGSYQWFEGYTKPICNKRGEVILILSCTRSIQDRKMAEMERKERESMQRHLLASAILLEKKKAIMQRLEARVLEIEPVVRQELKGVLGYIRETLKFDDDWEDFMIRFKKIHPNFYERMITRYPYLSKHETQLLAFIKLGMSSSEISKIQLIKKESLRVAKTRLKRKLGLDASQDLIRFIQEF